MLITQAWRCEPLPDKVTTNLSTEDTTMVNTAYKMSCQPIRGQAGRVLKTGQEIYELEDASFTTCPADDNSWRFKASAIELDQSDEWATFYNARFEVLDVPIFYLPYVTVPVGDTRKTGVLILALVLIVKMVLNFRFLFTGILHQITMQPRPLTIWKDVVLN